MKFNLILYSPDIRKILDSYYNCLSIKTKEIYSAFGVNLIVEDALPPGSALFFDHRGNIVAVYNDGELVEIPQDSAINHLAKYPLLLKKRPWRTEEDIDPGSASIKNKDLLPGRDSDHE